MNEEPASEGQGFDPSQLPPPPPSTPLPPPPPPPAPPTPPASGVRSDLPPPPPHGKYWSPSKAQEQFEQAKAAAAAQAEAKRAAKAADQEQKRRDREAAKAQARSDRVTSKEAKAEAKAEQERRRSDEAEAKAQAKRQAEEDAARAAAEQARSRAESARRMKADAERRTADYSGPHGVAALGSSRVKKLLDQNLLPGETVAAVVVGAAQGQAIVALDRRLLVIKVGVMAGATGGGRVTAFRYDDIVGIQTNTGLMMGALVVQTAGTNTTSGDYWASHGFGQANKNDDPFKLPNVIPVSKPILKKFAADLEWIRTRVRDASDPAFPPAAPAPTAPGPGSGDLATQLAALAELHRSGALTDEEFTAAKGRLLNP